MTYKCVYFDVGGVVIKDFSKTKKWLELKHALGVPDDLSNQFDELWSRIEGQVCVGLETEVARQQIELQLGIKLTTNGTLLDEFVNRFETNPSILPCMLEAQAISYKVGLLTNMYPGMMTKISSAGLLPKFDVNVVVDSSIVGTKKPDHHIFEVAQKHADCRPSEVLFIDNSQVHLDAAKSLGWKVHFYDSANYEQSSRQLLEAFSSLKP